MPIDYINDDGSFAEGWRDKALPEDLRSEAALEGIKDVAGLAKAFVNTKKMVGTRVELPKAENVPDWMRKHMKASEKAEDYQIGKPDDWPESVPYNEGMVKTFAEACAEQGVPVEMAKTLAGKVIASERETLAAALAEQQETRTKIAEASEAKLKEVWGEKFDTELELARRALAGEDVPEALRKTLAEMRGLETLSNDDMLNCLKADAVLAMMCHKIGTLTADDHHVSGAPAGGAPKEKEPGHKSRPWAYANRPDDDPEKQWFINRGYNFETGTYEGAEPT